MDEKTITLKGRDIGVKKLNDAQIALMTREANRAQRKSLDYQIRLEAVGRILDVLEAAIVSDDDKTYVVDLMVAGDLEMADLLPVITAFYSDTEETDKPVVRRGRPKRT